MGHGDEQVTAVGESGDAEDPTGGSSVEGSGGVDGAVPGDMTDLPSLVVHARTAGDRMAVVDATTGVGVRFRELDERSRRLAGRLAASGLGVGDTIAVLMGNEPATFETFWAAQRAGVYYVPLNWHLTAAEIAAIVADAGAGGLVVSHHLRAQAAAAIEVLQPPGVVLDVPDGPAGTTDRATLADGAVPPDGVSPEVDGAVMLYSSGTTGRPKGIKRPITGRPFTGTSMLDHLMASRYGFGPDTVYLSPSPLYHAAPLGWSLGTQRHGGTVVIMERFDPVGLLDAIARYRVTHVQMVPTMFVRLLKLPEEVRAAADLSSLRCVIHAAAPCPVDVKRQVLAWWGPIVHEYYAGSEGNGLCAIGPEEWLAHPGSVGRALAGEVHIVGEDGRELGPGEVGTIYFSGMPRFEYHNDPDKTRQAFDDRGWSTLGDLGHLDEDGYLYLSDRRTNLIIVGGVNVYPREAEDVLVLHPAVADVAVIGLPHEELGQQVVAVVAAADPSQAGPELADELIEHCRRHLAAFKCPRLVLFDQDLPRTATGKLAKHRLIERYRGRTVGSGGTPTD
jgi:acyl-CoA synthetase (AMP-forming)/AMP-acid ligase II